MLTTGGVSASNGRLLGEGQTLKGDLEQTSLTIESRWGHQFDFVEVFRERFPSRVEGDGNL